MQFDLSELARRAKNPRRKSITLRDMPPPQMLATNLYQQVYAPVIALWRRYADQITAEYYRSLSALTTDAPADINATLGRADNELQRLLLLLTPALRRWVVSVERWQRGKWRGAVLAASGVDLDTMLTAGDVEASVEQTIEWNTNLVADVSAQTRQRISSAVFAGLTARAPARDVAKQISEATGLARDRSLRIASDQLSKLTSALTDERQKQAGITQVEWRHSGKLHPRSWHRARDGVVYDLDTRTPIDGGEAVAADDWAGRPPFCGCRTRAVLTFE